MLTATFADGTQKTVLTDTTIYPTGSSMIRSHMELHMAEDAMTLEAFEEFLSDKEKTIKITLTMTDDAGDVLYENDYSYFVILAEVGKKTVQVIDTETGAVTEEKHLVARLEQLTYIEQQLQDLEIVDILLGRES